MRVEAAWPLESLIPNTFRSLLPGGAPHLQTVLGSQIRPLHEPPSRQVSLLLDDGDRLILDVSGPPDAAPDCPRVILLHGLCGSSRSSYMIRIARRLLSAGLEVFRVNLRNCGSGAWLSRNLYHSGRSEDALRVVQSLLAEKPEAPCALVGFSLGGNIALKLAGELAAAPPPGLAGVVAVSPPSDLLASVRRLSRGAGGLYERYFVSQLRAGAREHHEVYPDMPLPSLPPSLRLIDFDDLYTAPRCGFRSAYDYYGQASSLTVLGQIALPTRILVADDDPLIDSTALLDARLGNATLLTRTRHGGHLGFLGTPSRDNGLLWLDSWVVAAVDEVLTRHPQRRSSLALAGGDRSPYTAGHKS